MIYVVIGHLAGCMYLSELINLYLPIVCVPTRWYDINFQRFKIISDYFGMK